MFLFTETFLCLCLATNLVSYRSPFLHSILPKSAPCRLGLFSLSIASLSKDAKGAGIAHAALARLDHVAAALVAHEPESASLQGRSLTLTVTIIGVIVVITAVGARTVLGSAFACRDSSDAAAAAAAAAAVIAQSRLDSRHDDANRVPAAHGIARRAQHVQKGVVAAALGGLHGQRVEARDAVVDCCCGGAVVLGQARARAERVAAADGGADGRRREVGQYW